MKNVYQDYGFLSEIFSKFGYDEHFNEYLKYPIDSHCIKRWTKNIEPYEIEDIEIRQIPHSLQDNSEPTFHSNDEEFVNTVSFKKNETDDFWLELIDSSGILQSNLSSEEEKIYWQLFKDNETIDNVSLEGIKDILSKVKSTYETLTGNYKQWLADILDNQAPMGV